MFNFFFQDHSSDNCNDSNTTQTSNKDKPKYRRILFKDLPVNCPVHELTGESMRNKNELPSNGDHINKEQHFAH